MSLISIGLLYFKVEYNFKTHLPFENTDKTLKPDQTETNGF